MTPSLRYLEGRRSAGEKMRGRECATRGEAHPRSKLTEAQVREIRSRAWCGPGRENRPASLAREFGVSDSLVRGILDGRNWGWL